MSEYPTVEPHVQALRDALVADHEKQVADAQRLADESPDEWGRRFYSDRVKRLSAARYPWENTSRSA